MTCHVSTDVTCAQHPTRTLPDAGHVSDRSAADTPAVKALAPPCTVNDEPAHCEVNCRIMHSIEKSTRTMTQQI